MMKISIASTNRGQDWRFGRRLALGVTLLLLTFTTAAVAQQDASAYLTSPPPAPYVGVDTLTPLPAFIPGAGALFIDPDDAPVGPWLSYGTDGQLVEILFMVPISQMQQATNWMELGGTLVRLLGANLDHVDVTYNSGHPGMAEPHYHIRLVLLDEAAQQAALNP